MSERKDEIGKTAFHFVSHGGFHENQYVDAGMSLRDYFAAHCPTAEAELLLPATVGECGEWIGVGPDGYDSKKHYAIAMAKARYIWADAMVKASEVLP